MCSIFCAFFENRPFTTVDELFGREPLVNDICAQFPLRDDDTFRVVVARGKRVMLADDIDKTIDITFPKNCNETTRQYFKVEVFGNICCDASINGDVVSHGEIECNQINGDIKECKNNISCQGNINGNVNAGNNISCGGSIGDGTFEHKVLFIVTETKSCHVVLTCDVNGNLS